MNNQEDIYKDIFDPKPMEIITGDPNSFLFCCGKNESNELSFRNFKYISTPSGVKISNKYNVV